MTPILITGDNINGQSVLIAQRATMQVSNLIIHKDLTFDEYQQLPGHSFSSLKAKVFEPTVKMRLGTAVHSYLMDPKAFTGDIRIVKPLAMALRDCIGSLWEHLLMELSVTADFTYEGFKMAYRGRIDMCIPKRIVIDLKVVENVRKSMEWFMYPEQVTGYSSSVAAPVAFLIAINPKDRRTDIISVKFNQSWWCEKILLLGEVVP